MTGEILKEPYGKVLSLPLRIRMNKKQTQKFALQGLGFLKKSINLNKNPVNPVNFLHD